MKTFKNYKEALDWLFEGGKCKGEFHTNTGDIGGEMIIHTGLFEWSDKTIRTQKEPSTFAELAAFNIRHKL